eukprot:m.32601 g.32601  ORF g.32601 m.32601 type:complete len:265 (-) comp5554_c0_seq1:77-871(-)
MSDDAEREFQAALKLLKNLRQRDTTDYASIERMEPRINESSESTFRKLRGIYKASIDRAQQERSLLNALSRSLGGLIAAREAEGGGRLPVASRSKRKRQSSVINSLDSTLPTWPDCYPPPLCGALPAEPEATLVPGQWVAAMVSKTERSWILTVIIRAEPHSKYVVEDIVEDSDAHERHTLPRNAIIPLPCWEPLPGLADTFFPHGTQVLALYPQTTCFYHCVVHEPPTQDRATYLCHFDDDDYEDGRVRYQEVPTKFIVAFRD